MRKWIGLTVAAAVTVAVATTAVAWRVRGDPNIVMLSSDGGADWVRADRPFDLLAVRDTTAFVKAETTVTVPPGFLGATLSVAGLRRVGVDVDGRRLFDSGPTLSQWKRTYAVQLPATLAAGPHRLAVTAANRNGPALVRAGCDALDVHTGDGTWRATDDGKTWRPPARAADRWRPALDAAFGPSLAALWRCLPAVLVGFAVAVFVAVRWPGGDWGRRARWAVLGAWAVLGLADVTRVPPAYGYDAAMHCDYVQYVADHARLPPPDGGPEFFQAPLYYVVSAVLWRLLVACGASVEQVKLLIRVVPLACGAGLAEVCYRTARRAFPGRPTPQAVAVVFGGLIPVNLYMGLAVSNEPMAGLVGGLVALMGVRFLTRPADAGDRRWLAAAGGALGLAVLAKVTGGMWAVPLTAAVVVAARRRGASVGRAAADVACVAAVAAVVCGWYLVRTYQWTGSPIVSHALVHNAAWWQDPGYRTPASFVPTGRGLTRVALGSGVDSVWDSLYCTAWADGFLSGAIDVPGRVPWHIDLMAAGAWLALAPLAMMVAGVAVGRVAGGRWFPVASIAVFLTAVAWVYLTLPIYSCGKASYLLSTLPCAAVLAAAGFDRIADRRVRAVAAGWLATWAATAYLTYVVAS